MTYKEYIESIEGKTMEIVETLEDVHGGVGTYRSEKMVWRIGDELHMVTHERRPIPNPDKEKYGDYTSVTQSSSKIERVYRADRYDRNWTVKELLCERVEIW